MLIKKFESVEQMGQEAALYSADIINRKIQEQGRARIVLSTGASQFEFLKSLIKMDITWEKVEMFHLDEYVGLPEAHPASFRKYLKERFLQFINLKEAYFVNGEGNVEEHIQQLSSDLRSRPVDLALIGIGENAHIAFNDPPADFDTKAAYKMVALDDSCKRQQVSEGWFASLEDVPTHAITMTVHQIMQSEHIVSVVPLKAKAQAVKLTLENDVTNLIPATILKTHNSFTLFLDQNSASQLDSVN